MLIPLKNEKSLSRAGKGSFQNFFYGKDILAYPGGDFKGSVLSPNSSVGLCYARDDQSCLSGMDQAGDKSLVVTANNVCTNWLKRKYLLQERVRYWLNELSQDWRINNCMTRPTGSAITVCCENGHAYYRGLQTCGSVWVCPICSSKISAGRQAELESAKNADQFVKILLTMTFGHGRKDRLKDLIQDLNSAFRKMKSDRAWSGLKKEFGIEAYVSSLEFTFGLKNGWHAHRHVLLYCRRDGGYNTNFDELQGVLAETWAKILDKKGRYVSSIYGLDLRVGDDHASEYIQKWGLTSEITRSNVKVATGENISPFGLLTLDDDWAKNAFQEFAVATFGKRQITHSNNFRKILGIEKIKTDDELARSDEKEVEVLAVINNSAWKEIVSLGLRAEVLELAEKSPEQLKTLIDRMNNSPG